MAEKPVELGECYPTVAAVPSRAPAAEADALATGVQCLGCRSGSAGRWANVGPGHEPMWWCHACYAEGAKVTMVAMPIGGGTGTAGLGLHCSVFIGDGVNGKLRRRRR